LFNPSPDSRQRLLWRHARIIAHVLGGGVGGGPVLVQTVSWPPLLSMCPGNVVVHVVGWGVGWAWICPVGSLATLVALSGRFLSCRGGDTAAHCLVSWWPSVSGCRWVPGPMMIMIMIMTTSPIPTIRPTIPPPPPSSSCLLFLCGAHEGFGNFEPL